MGKAPVKQPPVIAVSGTIHPLRRRFIQEHVEKHRKLDWKIEYVDGSRPGALSTILQTAGGMFCEGAVIVVVTSPEDAPLNLIEEHYKNGDPEVVLILDYDGEPKGNTKFGKFLASMGKFHKSFSAPSEAWKLEPVVIDFVKDEATRRGKPMQEGLAKMMVTQIGTDFGFLAFEVQKMAHLADAEGSPTITLDIARRSISPIAQVLVFPIVEALAARNRKALVNALIRVKKTSKDNPTMRMSRLIQSTVLKWLSVRNLVDRGVTPEEAAVKIGGNPWYFRNVLAPQVANWKWRDICRLVQALAESERGVLDGHVDSWTAFTARLLEVCG